MAFFVFHSPTVEDSSLGEAGKTSGCFHQDDSKAPLHKRERKRYSNIIIYVCPETCRRLSDYLGNRGEGTYLSCMRTKGRISALCGQNNTHPHKGPAEVWSRISSYWSFVQVFPISYAFPCVLYFSILTLPAGTQSLLCSSSPWLPVPLIIGVVCQFSSTVEVMLNYLQW